LIVALACIGCSFDLEQLREAGDAAPEAPEDAGWPLEQLAVDATMNANAAQPESTALALQARPPDAAIEPLPNADVGDATPMCGVPGTPCCDNGTCDTGTCLRGQCSAFGGHFARHTDAATCASGCAVRNPYTAGCSCPAGFDELPSVPTAHSCTDGQDPEAATLVFCSSPAAAGGAWLGAYVHTIDPSDCQPRCSVQNPYLDACECPAGAVTLTLSLGADSGCGETSSKSLNLCFGANADATWAGVYQRNRVGDCDLENPLTGACSCPEGAQTLELLQEPSPAYLCLL